MKLISKSPARGFTTEFTTTAHTLSSTPVQQTARGLTSSSGSSLKSQLIAIVFLHPPMNVQPGTPQLSAGAVRARTALIVTAAVTSTHQREAGPAQSHRPGQGRTGQGQTRRQQTRQEQTRYRNRYGNRPRREQTQAGIDPAECRAITTRPCQPIRAGSRLRSGRTRPRRPTECTTTAPVRPGWTASTYIHGVPPLPAYLSDVRITVDDTRVMC